LRQSGRKQLVLICLTFIATPHYGREKRYMHFTHAPVTRQQITGDGNCYFQTISFILTGKANQHSEFRQILINYMTVSPTSNAINTFLQHYENQTVLEYVSTTNMDKEGTWATEVEI